MTRRRVFVWVVWLALVTALVLMVDAGLDDGTCRTDCVTTQEEP